MSESARRDPVGSVLGLVVFLGGVGLLALTFKLAFEIFQVPPAQALKLKSGETLDIAATGSALIGITVRILTLLLMAIIGSLIANRGIAMYTACRAGFPRKKGSASPSGPE
jgi:hypothetical protein